MADLGDGLTLRLATPAAKDLPVGSLCVFAAPGTEARARASVWDELKANHPERCIEVVDQQPRNLVYELEGQHTSVSLVGADGLQALVRQFSSVCLDISGLAHHVWASLLRLALSEATQVHAVYFEPARYRPHSSPTSTSLYDLSDSFRGIEPLPGFANLRGPQEDKGALYVPFLGFEGTRAPYLASALGDPVPRVIPVVGVPGFRFDYQQVAVSSHQYFLDEHRAHADIRFARASCPFEAYEVLAEIRKDHPGKYLYIAPIGTKPHALGAIWYALQHPTDTEILYDHPVRKPKRTEGVGLAHIYTLKPSSVCA